MSLTLELTGPSSALEASLWENHSRLDLLRGLDAYIRWLCERVRPFVQGEVCEVGCGTGNMIQFLLDHPRIVGLEPFGPSLEEARLRFADRRNVSFLDYWIHECPNEDVPTDSFDTILCMNVLEHIEDDVDALQRMAALTRETGRLVILVPAHASAFGGLDRTAGHFRRYNRRGLRGAFERAGLHVSHSFYMNALGYFGWFWYARVLNRKELPAGPARWFNRLVPLLGAVEQLIKPPFGQSLVMVGERR